MAIELTNRTRRALQDLAIEPNLVVRIEGYDTLFGASAIREFLTYGYPDAFYGGDGLFYGGLVDIINQKPYIDSQSTSYTIRQQMSYDDEAGASSISTMTIGLVDKNGEVSELISPGFLVEDVLGRRVDIFQSYGDTDFFEDALLLFRGFITKVISEPGLIKFTVNHPDNKKNIQLFNVAETTVDGNINATQTSIVVEDATNFRLPEGPMSTYIRINEEVIRYTTIVGNTIVGVTRAQLGTTASAHTSGDRVGSVYALEGNPFDLALQLMMSGFGTDPVHEGIEVKSFVRVGSGNLEIPNAIYFEKINLDQEFGITAGDTVTITGAEIGANNFVQRTVTEVTQFESGYYLVVDGAALVRQNDSAAVMATFSQYNTLSEGMRMKPEDVDVAEHLRIRDLFFSSVQYRIFIKEDDIQGKEFLDEQIYRPLACYSLPRKSRASVGYTIGPIPGEQLTTLDETNIKDPDKVAITRTTNRAFFNEVVYAYDDDPRVDDESFLTGQVYISETSKNRIPGSTKTYVVNSIGLRTDLNAQAIADINSNRILDRYKFGAELVTLRALLRDTVQIEIGDIVIAELEQLQVTDITKGNRVFKSRFFEVQNKTINLKTGNVEFVLLDTGINIDTRFGLISPCSLITGVTSQQQFTIGADPFYNSKFGEDEFRHWLPAYTQGSTMGIKIRNADYSINENVLLTNINENQFTLDAPAVTLLQPGLFVEFAEYEDPVTQLKQTLIYAYMNDNPLFNDGEAQYSML